MRWIEPTASPSMMAPSARTSAFTRRLASVSLSPGAIMPRSIRAENATRGASRAVWKVASDASGSGSTAAMGALAASGEAGVRPIPPDPGEAPPQPLGRRPGGAGAAERVEHQVVRARGRQDHAGEQRLRLLGRVQLLLVLALETLLAGAQRQGPVRAHLDILVAGLEGLVIEGVAARRGVAARPDQCLVRVGEAAAAEIRHRVRLAPDHVVEDPEAEVLQDRADAEDVVVGADHPQRRAPLHPPAAGR